MKEFIIVALYGIGSFLVFNYLLKIIGMRFKAISNLQEKVSKMKNRKLYSNLFTLALVIIIVVIRQMFDLGYLGYGLLLGGLLAISAFTFDKIEIQEDNKQEYKNNKPINNKKNIKKR